MPIYMDRHYLEGGTHQTLVNAHMQDLATQDKYGVRFLTYWFDEARSTAFCLVDAPDKDAIQKAHDDAHGNVPNETIEVDLFGITVQLAARFCAHAEPDQILATEEVVEPSTRERSQFSSAGSITLKGFDYSVQVYEVRWQEN